MKSLSKILIIGCFLAIGLATYAGSKTGWGIDKFNDPEISQNIEKDCPEHRKDKNGECLRNSFRSSYFIYRSTGSFGSGK